VENNQDGNELTPADLPEAMIVKMLCVWCKLCNV